MMGHNDLSAFRVTSFLGLDFLTMMNFYDRLPYLLNGSRKRDFEQKIGLIQLKFYSQLTEGKVTVKRVPLPI